MKNRGLKIGNIAAKNERFPKSEAKIWKEQRVEKQQKMNNFC